MGMFAVNAFLILLLVIIAVLALRVHPHAEPSALFLGLLTEDVIDGGNQYNHGAWDGGCRFGARSIPSWPHRAVPEQRLGAS